jgi:hypothetical protein
MTRDAANRILSQLKSGDADFSRKVITMALMATGDIAEPRRAPSPVLWAVETLTSNDRRPQCGA